MSLGTTTIDSLPISNTTAEPVQISNTENVKIENYGQQLNAERSTEAQIPPIDYTSQLTSALKDAQSSGATVLPSRDIPQQTLGIQNDYQTKPDYIPESKSEDYIGDIFDKEKIIIDNKKKQNQQDNLDYLYQSIQLPLLVGILYFLFQLPFIRKNILTFLPNLFKKEGNPNLYGYIFNSVMFAILYSGIVFGLHYLKNNL